MRYFKNHAGDVFAFDDDAIAPESFVRMTDEEVAAHLQTVLSVQVPQSVTRRQALLALLAAGLLDDVEAIIAAAPRAVQIAWDASSVFQRNNALIASMAEQLELSDEDVDALFVQASTL